MNKKRGRPKLPPTETRKPRLTIRLLEAEENEINDAIAKSGKPKSDWIRDALLGTAKAEFDLAAKNPSLPK